MRSDHHHTREGLAAFIEALDTFQVEVIGGLIKYDQVGFCSIIRLTIQRTFSPPLNTLVFFWISSPLNSILPRKPRIKGSSASVTCAEHTGAANPSASIPGKELLVLLWQVGFGNSGTPFKFTGIGLHSRR
jgi:hypothetical protein